MSKKILNSSVRIGENKGNVKHFILEGAKLKRNVDNWGEEVIFLPK